MQLLTRDLAARQEPVADQVQQYTSLPRHAVHHPSNKNVSLLVVQTIERLHKVPLPAPLPSALSLVALPIALSLGIKHVTHSSPLRLQRISTRLDPLSLISKLG